MLASLAFAAISLLTLSGRADEPSIWYRTGDGCPDGASFLERLAQRGVRGHLAAVGDHVDFVVTLGAKGERSSGRLERQTSSGTIAIREVQDVRCEAVADALALTLALTLDPASQNPTAPAPVAASPNPEAPPPRSGATAPASVAFAPDASAAPPQSERAPPPAEPGEPLTGPAKEQGAAQGAVRLGAAMAAWDLFQGPWVLGAGPFGEVEAPASFILPRATLRLVLQGGLRADAAQSVHLRLAAARVEACPLALGRGSISLRPCAALDAGAIGASAAALADIAAWAAVAAHARLRVELGRMGLEMQAGGIVPITHYEVTRASSTYILEETRDLGFAAGIGVGVRLE